MHVPALQIAVHRTGLGIFPHHRAAVHMGGLVAGGIEMAVGVFRAASNQFRVHGLGDRRHFVVHKLRHLDVVFLPVERHAQQWLAEHVLVVGIEVQIVAAIRLMRAVGVHRQMMGVGVRYCRFPLAAPGRSARRGWQAGDRFGARLVDPERRTANEACFGMVKVVGVEIVDPDPVTTRADKRVSEDVFVEERLDGGQILVSEVTAYHTFAGHRIVRFTDAGQQHQMHVVELERPQDHQLRRLFDFTALRVNVVHPGRTRLVGGQVHFQHVGVGAQFEAFLHAQCRQNIDVRRGFGIHVAGVTTAESAEVARPHLRAIRVGIGIRSVGGRQVIRVIAHVPRRFLEHLRRERILLRRQREVVGTVSREGVSALRRHLLPLNGPGGAGGSEHFFGLVEERLQLVVGDTEVLDSHVLRDKAFAITLFVMATHAQLNRVDAKMHTRPVQACAAHAGTRQERRQLTVRNRSLAGIVTNGHGAFRQILEQLAADVIGQFVDHLRIGTVRIGIAHWAALQRHHVQPRFGQLFGHNRAHPTEADDHRVYFFHYRCHCYPLSPRIETGGKG
ncbi:Uncharacterised protein [Serratia quinivorans]|nr:Uncharacterised protein [Serratia quinivorans]